MKLRNCLQRHVVGLLYSAATMLLVGAMVVTYGIAVAAIRASRKMSAQLLVLQQVEDVLSQSQ